MLLASAGAAAAETVTLDPQQTAIQWTLRGFPDTVHGTFRLASGALDLDAASGAAEGCLRVDARSGQSGNTSRDQKMHEQILESARYPEVALRPTHVEGALPADGDGALTLQGVLSLHGASHPVTLPVRVTRKSERLVADTTLTIPYVAWGLTDPSVFIFRAAKTVELELHAVGALTTSPAPARIAACAP
jgi:polyisoprenoid-binding protein YceI